MNAPRPTRRTLTRAAAWTVPVVAVATAAPAFAASPCNCPEFYFQPFPNSGTLGNGWAISTVSGTQEGGGTNQFISGGVFDPPGDPAAGNTLVVQAARTICVTAGRTYRFTYGYTAYLANPRPQTSVLRVNGVNVTGSTIDTTSSGASGSRAVTWTANTTGNVTMAFVHTTAADANSRIGNEIRINNVAGTCS
ncbi:hypothetical protein [Nocardioides hwasunensis]|uniref:DUF642 domain-containing protein n=1 Tax=Nocardioides hwasunensis TaxID=397258 RepID=A0ABR8MHG2_9ACTN|nr:hypothetical protein [Nocardioides hwasunensis]MBD3915504.1 hypothetical protein [Nocardioides hwasunensis]